MNAADIDRLATFCRLSERGYFQWDNGHWGRRPMEEWQPDDSHDDWQMVAEEAERRGLLEPLLVALYHLSGADDDEHDSLSFHRVYERFLLLATPAEKCEAMLRVLDSQPKESTDG